MSRGGRKKSGFGAVEILVVIGVVAILIVVGWLIFLNIKERSLNNSAANDSQTSAQDHVDDDSPTVQRYMFVKEWGIKVPLSEDIEDAYYASEGGPDNRVKASTKIWLGLTRFTGEQCNPDSNNRGGSGAIGAIVRADPNERDFVTGKSIQEDLPNGVVIGKYYYAYYSWKTENTCKTAAELKDIDAAFAAAARKITITNNE